MQLLKPGGRSGIGERSIVARMYTPKLASNAGSSIELSNLWNRVFGDDLSYIYRFYHHFQNHIDICIQCTPEDEIVSAAHFIPVSYRYFRQDHNGSYLYAAMTDPEHRGNNLMGQLLELRLKQAYIDEEFFMCTLPAEQSLYDLYARFGFEPVFSLHRSTVSRQQLVNSRLTLSFSSKASPAYAYSSTFARRELTILKDKIFIEYTSKENDARNGAFRSVYSGYFYARQLSEDRVYVKELYLHGDNFPYIAHMLLELYPEAEQFVFDFCPAACPDQFQYTSVRAGAGRITHAYNALCAYAKKHHDVALKFSLEDPIIEQNTADYYMKDGIVKKTERKMELAPMSLSAFTRMILTDGGGGMPYMNMMLD